jgi:hypothetical protein
MKIRRLASWAAAALLATGGTVFLAQPASAAVPDRFGFVLWSGGGVSQAQPAGTTVVPGVPGRWTVTFPGQGIAGGVVHVTAVHDALTFPPGRWCQAEAWGNVGGNEVVRVACYRPGGFLDPQPGFSVQFARSSGVVGAGFYGYIDSNPAGAIIDQYSSLGFANNVFHAGVGMYSVAFIGMGTPGPQDDSLQVTAANPGVGARCKVASFNSSANGQFARIFCFNSAGAFADNRFTVTYQFRRSLYGPAFPPGRFGYLWTIPPLGPPSTVFNSTGGPVGFGAGPPVWTVAWANLYTTAPSNTQVTAFGTTSHFCGLHKPWGPSGTTLIANVNCFTNAGVPVVSGFFASHSSRV